MEILLVEDDVVLAKVLSEVIERWEYPVDVASTGKEAVLKVKNKWFDLILLDIFLPDFMGYELIPEFKKYSSGINIITMTGYNTPEMERKIRGYGIAYYMAKPVSYKELKSILVHLSGKISNKETHV